MLKRFKNRRWNPCLTVQVYKNLHKNCYSVRQRGLIIGHADTIILMSPSFTVSEKGVQKIRQEKKKSVIAWVEGYILPCNSESYSSLVNLLTQGEKSLDITFNPYKHEEFVCTKDSKPIKIAQCCLLEEKLKRVLL